MRYKGAKGMLVGNDNLQDNEIILRDSMVKFEC